MPVFYVNLKKQDCLEREPYASFLKKFDVIKNEPHGEEIELRVGGKDGSFSNGFYVDRFYYSNPRLRIRFARVPSPENGGEEHTLVRVTYSYEREDGYDLDFHLQRVKDIKKRAPYYYLPNVTGFEFSSQIDDEYRLFFDALVEKRDKVSEVCCTLISLIIAIFSLDD